MRNVSFCFSIHQPYRLVDYRFNKIGEDHEYFDVELNQSVIRKVSENCYLPLNYLFKKLINDLGLTFKVSFSVSGSALEQLKELEPETFLSFQELFAFDNIELLSTPYFHSLSSLSSKEQFFREISKHENTVLQYFGKRTKSLANTDLIFESSSIDENLSSSYSNIIISDDNISEGVFQVPKSKTNILFKNTILEKFIDKQFANNQKVDIVKSVEFFINELKVGFPDNSFLLFYIEYDVFGEIFKRSSGIIDFIEELFHQLSNDKSFQFINPKDLPANPDIPIKKLTLPDIKKSSNKLFRSWEWNNMQKEALNFLYELEPVVIKNKDKTYLEKWHQLLSIDHFNNMATTPSSLTYNRNLFNSPFDAFISYMNILTDMKTTIRKGKVKKNKEM